MKLFNNCSLFLIILQALFSHTASAENLCDAACNLHIDFTGSGSIEAVDTLTITFGSGGVVNDGSVATGYSAGDVLLLRAGDTLVFNAGGELDLGEAGNIDYTTMNLFVDGDMSLAGVGGSATISFHGDSTISLNGTLSLESDASLSARLQFPESNTLISGGGILSIDSDGSLDLGSYTYGSLLDISDTDLPLSSVDLNEAQESLLNMEAPVLLSQSDLIKLEGESFLLHDGNSCTVSNGKCFDPSGTEYRVENGVLTTVSGNSGCVSFFNILSLFLFYLAFSLKAVLLRSSLNNS